MTTFEGYKPPFKMNPELKERWLNELRSGKYTRGTNALKTFDEGVTSHCCLGVLCEIAIEDGVRKSVPKLWSGNGRWTPEKDRQGLFLPPGVQKWSGIDLNTQQFLASMNDNEEPEDGKFIKVVEWIEANL